VGDADEPSFEDDGVGVREPTRIRLPGRQAVPCTVGQLTADLCKERPQRHRERVPPLVRRRPRAARRRGGNRPLGDVGPGRPGGVLTGVPFVRGKRPRPPVRVEPASGATVTCRDRWYVHPSHDATAGVRENGWKLPKFCFPRHTMWRNRVIKGQFGKIKIFLPNVARARAAVPATAGGKAEFHPERSRGSRRPLTKPLARSISGERPALVS